MISLGPAFQRGWVPVCLSIFLLGKLRNFPSRFPLKFHWPKLSHTAAIAAEAAKVENSPTIMTHFGGFSLLPPEKIGILFSCEAVGKWGSNIMDRQLSVWHIREGFPHYKIIKIISSCFLLILLRLNFFISVLTYLVFILILILEYGYNFFLRWLPTLS